MALPDNFQTVLFLTLKSLRPFHRVVLSKVLRKCSEACHNRVLAPTSKYIEPILLMDERDVNYSQASIYMNDISFPCLAE